MPAGMSTLTSYLAYFLITNIFLVIQWTLIHPTVVAEASCLALLPHDSPVPVRELLATFEYPVETDLTEADLPLVSPFGILIPSPVLAITPILVHARAPALPVRTLGAPSRVDIISLTKPFEPRQPLYVTAASNLAIMLTTVQRLASNNPALVPRNPPDARETIVDLGDKSG